MRVSPMLATSVTPGLLVFLQRIEAGGLASARHRISNWSRPSSSWPVGTPTNLVSGASKFMRNAQLITRTLIPRAALNIHIYITVYVIQVIIRRILWYITQNSENNFHSFNYRNTMHWLRQNLLKQMSILIKKMIIFYFCLFLIINLDCLKFRQYLIDLPLQILID